MDVFWNEKGKYLKSIWKYIYFLFTKAKFNIMVSKLNFSPAQGKEILDAYENTLMKFFNTATERLREKSWQLDNG